MSVRFAILGLLAQHPRHGYDLHSAFEAVVGDDPEWDVKPAQVYSTLNRLEESGLVRRVSDLGEGNEPDRRIYEITDKGSYALQEWFSTSVTSDHQRDEFFLKLMAGLVSGQADPVRLIQTQRSHLFQELHDAITQREIYDPRTELAQILRLDKTIMHLEAELRWLDIIEQRLEDIKEQPLPEPDLRPRGRPRRE
ncbi:MAG: PadR family transcriptional regulator [Anaerolineaceae bacterium]|jgi:DNA-binding PadR family transcriptional regulator